MNSKKMTVIRIIIFTAIANGMVILAYILSDIFPAFGNLLFTAAALSPAIANVLTRLITKEGFKNNFLCANLKGNLRYYFGGLGFAAALQFCGAVMLIVFLLPEYSFKDIEFNIGKVGYLLLSIVYVLVDFWYLFGEEFGWRAYLTPKLEEVMPEPLALIVSGIIWGMWHACPIAEGLNFGFDYPGFPYLGWVAMCVPTIFYGAALTYLTKKTNSVFPAVFCHTAMDMLAVLGTLLPEGADLETGSKSFEAGILVFMPHVIIGAVFFYLLCRKKKTAEIIKETL
ncbi:MAG: CPBP family intramembrane glutamic endopeptidase [Oscillospiraceae bacterium]